MKQEVEILKKIGLVIRNKRRNKGYTQKQLSEIAKIHTNRISDIENGHNTTVQALILLANALNTDFFTLVDKAKNTTL